MASNISTPRERQILRNPWLADDDVIAALGILLGRLDEQQRRHLAGFLSLTIGHGGDTRIAEVSGLDDDTVRRGRRELANGLEGVPDDRVRCEGAGAKPITQQVPGIEEALAALVETDTGGDPQTGRKWTRRSVRRLAEELSERIGRTVSRETVRRLLHQKSSR